MRYPRGTALIVASHNPGKVREIAALLAPFAFVVKSASELGLPEPEETGASFAANAELKARAAAEAAGMLALADDSGLAVEALEGAPGIYSARWAGPEKDFAFAIARVERELAEKTVQNARAKFVCALALATPHGACEPLGATPHGACLVFEGEVHGNLTFPPRGTRGFGYDPIFVAEGTSETFGEIDPELKHRISHRAKAFAKFVAYLESK